MKFLLKILLLVAIPTTAFTQTAELQFVTAGQYLTDTEPKDGVFSPLLYSENFSEIPSAAGFLFAYDLPHANTEGESRYLYTRDFTSIGESQLAGKSYLIHFIPHFATVGEINVGQISAQELLTDDAVLNLATLHSRLSRPLNNSAVFASSVPLVAKNILAEDGREAQPFFEQYLKKERAAEFDPTENEPLFPTSTEVTYQRFATEFGMLYYSSYQYGNPCSDEEFGELSLLYWLENDELVPFVETASEPKLWMVNGELWIYTEGYGTRSLLRYDGRKMKEGLNDEIPNFDCGC